MEYHHDPAVLVTRLEQRAVVEWQKKGFRAAYEELEGRSGKEASQ